MPDGGADPPAERADDPIAEPLGALPAGPRPVVDGSGWRINWWGFVPLAIVAAIVFVGFRAVGFGDDDSADLAAAPDTIELTTTRPQPTTTSTVAPTTTSTVPPTTTVPPATIPVPTVHAFGEVKPCRFGDACLSVSFTISGFADPPPTAYLCIYPNSERQFTFNGAGKEEACLTGDEGDVVYVDVTGVRSQPVSAANLNP